jgi:hypothetical protein
MYGYLWEEIAMDEGVQRRATWGEPSADRFGYAIIITLCALAMELRDAALRIWVVPGVRSRSFCSVILLLWLCKAVRVGHSSCLFESTVKLLSPPIVVSRDSFATEIIQGQLSDHVLKDTVGQPLR